MSTTSQASQRINALLDENSFVEIGALVTARATDFNLKQTETPSDGVITGYGVIDGNLVYVYSQDASVLNGTIGEMHAKKIAGLYDLAMKMGAPVIGLIDSAGLRLQEATDALNGFGEIYKKQVDASGVIPQITAIFGTCGGGLAVVRKDKAVDIGQDTALESALVLFQSSLQLTGALVQGIHPGDRRIHNCLFLFHDKNSFLNYSFFECSLAGKYKNNPITLG